MEIKDFNDAGMGKRSLDLFLLQLSMEGRLDFKTSSHIAIAPSQLLPLGKRSTVRSTATAVIMVGLGQLLLY